jgi:hypothetical protein
MREGGAGSPEIVLTSIPGPYDGHRIFATVHVHFTGTTSSATAAIVLLQPATPGCTGFGTGIRADGSFHVIGNAPYLSPCQQIYDTYPVSVIPGDYDLGVALQNGTGIYSVNGITMGDGGVTGTGTLVGLVVIDPAASGSTVEFSNLEVQQWG